MKNPTSEPISPASSARRLRDRPPCSSSFRADSTHAASLLPPPSPAPWGTFLTRRTCHGMGRPSSRSISRPAFMTRLLSSSGTPGASQLISRPSAGKNSSTSHNSRGTITVSTSWKPSALLPRTRRETFTLHGALQLIIRHGFHQGTASGSSPHWAQMDGHAFFLRKFRGLRYNRRDPAAHGLRRKQH